MFNPKLLGLLGIRRLLVLRCFSCFSSYQVPVFLRGTDLLLLLLLLESLLLKQANFSRFFERELGVLAIDAFWVDHVT